ncbi:hypothetical protein [Kribbella lupini]
MTVLWIVVGLAAVVIVLALLAGAAKNSKRRHNEQLAQEHEQQAEVAAAHANKQQAAADEVDARAREAQAGRSDGRARDGIAQDGVVRDGATRNADARDTSPDTASWGTDAGRAREAERNRVETRSTPDTADQPMLGATDDQVEPGAVAHSADGGGPAVSGADGSGRRDGRLGAVDSQRDVVQVDEQGDGCPADMNSEQFGGTPDGMRAEAAGSEQSPKHAAPPR